MDSPILHISRRETSPAYIAKNTLEKIPFDFDVIEYIWHTNSQCWFPVNIPHTFVPQNLSGNTLSASTTQFIILGVISAPP